MKQILWSIKKGNSVYNLKGL